MVVGWVLLKGNYHIIFRDEQLPSQKMALEAFVGAAARSALELWLEGSKGASRNGAAAECQRRWRQDYYRNQWLVLPQKF